MLYPANLEEKLAFDKIRLLLKEACISSLGQTFVDKIRFSDNYELIDKLNQQTAEFCRILTEEESFPQQNYLDIQPQLVKATAENSFLTEEEFFEFKLSLVTIYECLKFFRNKGEEAYPFLFELSKDIVLDKKLIEKTELVIDERGKIRDDASFELRAIRTRLISEQNQLRKRLEQVLKNVKNLGFAEEDANITIRDGRMVIPVQAESKRQIKGLIHDESATGKTVFLEPTEIFDLNNTIKELQYEERREIIRILTRLTDEVRPHIPHLKKACNFLGMVDFIRAKAKFALQIGAVNPVFVKKPSTDWKQTRHPLLYLSLQGQKKSIVPLTITLNEKNRILLISGPNAGGKSVALKTVGLVQYMYQCGLLVPMREDSVMGLYKDIFLDMGDEQSLENDLSTYSSHLSNMKYFLNFSHKYTLFLIDEFGTGTEPSMGGAIAEAILEKLNLNRAFGVITTHYTNLKYFAQHTDGLVNGAMRFDADHLEPLFELETGKPGSSYAFEIARKIGLPQQIIDKGRRNAGDQKVNFDVLLRELEVEKNRFEVQNKLLTEKTKKMEEITEQYEKLKNYLDTEKKVILNKAKEEAKSILKQANQKIEQAIRSIKEKQAEKEVVKELRNEIQQFEKEALATEFVEEKLVQEEFEVVIGEIKVGDLIRVKGQNAVGEVMLLKGKNAEILLGGLKSNIKLNRLEKISKKVFKEEQKEIAQSFKGVDLNEKMVNFSFNLDLRGKRGEEAMQALEEFMDDALLLGYDELRIIHGKGDGILRKLVRELLRKYKQVQSMKDEHADRGGAGVTIVKLS